MIIEHETENQSMSTDVSVEQDWINSGLQLKSLHYNWKTIHKIIDLQKELKVLIQENQNCVYKIDLTQKNQFYDLIIQILEQENTLLFDLFDLEFYKKYDVMRERMGKNINIQAIRYQQQLFNKHYDFPKQNEKKCEKFTKFFMLYNKAKQEDQINRQRAQQRKFNSNLKNHLQQGKQQQLEQSVDFDKISEIGSFLKEEDNLSQISFCQSQPSEVSTSVSEQSIKCYNNNRPTKNSNYFKQNTVETKHYPVGLELEVNQDGKKSLLEKIKQFFLKKE